MLPSTPAVDRDLAAWRSRTWVGHSVDPARWAAETDRLLDRIAGRFTRVETRRRARSFVHGLLAELPSRNCWSLAEHAGDIDPHAMQYFLGRASCDTDGVITFVK